MFLVGLTGGIGSGKSTVAARLAELGVEVIDADQIAREVVEPGEPALADLVDRFGEQILKADGTLDRSSLATAAFADEASRAALDRITHPHIAGRIASRVAALGARNGARPDDLVVVDHPLLIETNQAGRFDAVVVVLASERVRYRRLQDDRGLQEADIAARMRAQTDDATRRSFATHLVTNDGPLEDLLAQTDSLYSELVLAARTAAGT